MKLSVKALAMASAIAWGGCLLFIAVANLILPVYGELWLQLAQSIYPGYNGPAGLGSVIIVTLYGAVDGAVLGTVIAWLYNRFAAVNREATAA